MQMGALVTIGYYKANNLYHIVFDNVAHECTGGRPTVEFEKVALACGYKVAKTVETKAELEKKIKEMKSSQDPQMLIVKVNRGARKDLGRPTKTPIENKKEFMKNLSKE